MFAKLGNFDVDYVSNTNNQETPHGNMEWNRESFVQNTLSTIFWGKFNPKMDVMRTFVWKARALFLDFKKSREGFHSPPLVTRVTHKGHAEFRICLIMAPYASLMPEHVQIYLNIPLICLNMTEYCWISFNMSENA